MIGERTNVTGSKKFARLIKEENYEEAIEIARQQVVGGANVIDINMDEALLDGEAVMTKFLRLIAGRERRRRGAGDGRQQQVVGHRSGAQVAAGQADRQFDQPQGRRGGVPAPRASCAAGTATAVVVMAFDEQGQAVEVDDKVRICRRAFELLTEKIGFPPQDIIFDPNILTVATGIEEHNNYAVNFIESIRRIKEACPGVHISGGVSNVSFSFRGNDLVREAIHAAFLYHAIQAGLDMGIVNAGQLAVYEDIEPKLKELVEDVLLNRRPDATERLVEHAETIKGKGSCGGRAKTKPGAPSRSASGSSTPSSRASSNTSTKTRKRPARHSPRACRLSKVR